MPVDEASSSNKMTPLHYACTYGFFEAVEELLSHDADWKLADASGRTCLMVASRGAHTKIVKRLLEAPGSKQTAHLNNVDAMGATAVWHAASRGSVDAVNALLFHGADVTIEDKTHCLTPAGIAMEQGHSELAQQLEVAYEAQVRHMLKGFQPFESTASVERTTIRLWTACV